jgi:uncharacterized protein (UPF0262 family)
MAERSGTDRIAAVELDERTLPRRTKEIEHERAAAMADLVDDNFFRAVDGPAGPYRLRLSLADARLCLDIRDAGGGPAAEATLPLPAFRGMVRDYRAICESYDAAMREASAARIESIDMGRRGLHDEAAELLRDRLQGPVEIDHATARRLFTLLCALHIRSGDIVL